MIVYMRQRYIELDELQKFIEEEANLMGVAKFAEYLGVSRQTVYSLMAGSWPQMRVMNRLGLTLVWGRKKNGR